MGQSTKLHNLQQMRLAYETNAGVWVGRELDYLVQGVGIRHLHLGFGTCIGRTERFLSWTSLLDVVRISCIRTFQTDHCYAYLLFSLPDS